MLFGPTKRGRARRELTTMRDLFSRSFDEWFDGSRVVDGHGAPRAMYHGTCNLFHAFRPFSHFGTAFSADVGVWRSRKEWGYAMLYPSELSRYHQYDRYERLKPGTSAGHHYPVYLRICSPLEIRDSGDNHEIEDLAILAEEKGVIGWYDRRLVEKAGKISPEFAAKVLAKKLLIGGVDGFVYQTSFEDVGTSCWVNILPRQVRHAFARNSSMHASISSPSFSCSPLNLEDEFA